MSQAVKLVIIAAVLVVASTVSVFTVTAASSLVVSPYMNGRASHVAEFKVPIKPLSFATFATTTAEAPPFLRELDETIGGRIAVAFNTVAEEPLTSFSPSASSLPIIHAPAQPRDSDGSRMIFNAPMLAPTGFVLFCSHYPKDCEPTTEPSEPQLASLTEVRWAELAMVNSEVNRSIKPSEKIIASPDEWLVFPREGKCTDYAITKRHELLGLGWPGSSLLLTEVVIPSGEHHLVLVARTGEADLVLDNLDDNIRPITEVAYRWVRAQQPKNPKFWATTKVSGTVQVAAR